MKTLSFTIVLVMVFLAGCKSTKIIKGNYEYIEFKRTGGGQIFFNVLKTDDESKLKVLVTSYKFKDTNLELTLEKDSTSSVAFTNFYKAISNQAQINGDFKQPTAPTGTWASIFVVADKKQTEITNIELRNSLLQFETLVKSKLK